VLARLRTSDPLRDGPAQVAEAARKERPLMAARLHGETGTVERDKRGDALERKTASLSCSTRCPARSRKQTTMREAVLAGYGLADAARQTRFLPLPELPSVLRSLPWSEDLRARHLVQLGRSAWNEAGDFSRTRFLADALGNVGLSILKTELGIAALMSGAKSAADISLRANKYREVTKAITASLSVRSWTVFGKGESASPSENAMIRAVWTAIGLTAWWCGFSHAQSLITALIPNTLVVGSQRDPKTLLQEAIQRDGALPPTYTTVADPGDPTMFIATVRAGRFSESGRGPSKRKAEFDAAARALGRFRVTPSVPETAAASPCWTAHSTRPFQRELDRIENSLNYKFRDTRLAALASTHATYLNESRVGIASNATLAGQGANLLQAVTALLTIEHLATRPQVSLDALATIVSLLTRESGHHKLARALGLDGVVRTGRGQSSMEAPRIEADTLQAIAAAVFIDSERMLPDGLPKPILSLIRTDISAHSNRSLRDLLLEAAPISYLQDLAQALELQWSPLQPPNVGIVLSDTSAQSVSVEAASPEAAARTVGEILINAERGPESLPAASAPLGIQRALFRFVVEHSVSALQRGRAAGLRRLGLFALDNVGTEADAHERLRGVYRTAVACGLATNILDALRAELEAATSGARTSVSDAITAFLTEFELQVRNAEISSEAATRALGGVPEVVSLLGRLRASARSPIPVGELLDALQLLSGRAIATRVNIVAAADARSVSLLEQPGLLLETVAMLVRGVEVCTLSVNTSANEVKVVCSPCSAAEVARLAESPCREILRFGANAAVTVEDTGATLTIDQPASHEANDAFMWASAIVSSWTHQPISEAFEHVAKILHDAKNYVLAMAASAERATSEPHRRLRLLGDAEEARERALEMIAQCRQIAAPYREPLVGRMNVLSLLRDVTAELAKQLPTRIALSTRIPPGQAVILGDRLLLQLALKNLVKNAVEAQPGEGEVELTAAIEGGVVKLWIRDRGHGFDERSIALLETGGSTVSSRIGGSGVGLPAVRHVARIHRGRLAVANRADGGAEVGIELPLAGIDLVGTDTGGGDDADTVG